jgi:hypothetical protein
MSVTEIEHNATAKRLELSCKLFTDDFEKTLRTKYKGTVDLTHPSNKAAMDKLVRYLYFATPSNCCRRQARCFTILRI